MPYILNKTNGTILTTVQDAALDASTDLTFVGKNFAGYGEIQNENFLKLLENFANTSSPDKPIIGQIYYNTLDKKLYAYNGTDWVGIGNLEVNNITPTQTLNIGDLWYDSTNQQLKVFNGSAYVVIGPTSGFDAQAGWRGSFEYNYSEAEGLLTKYNIKAVFESNNDDIVSVISAETYDLDAENISDSLPVYPNLTKIYRGINLVGADPVTGNSELVNNYFWGTAAHSLRSNTATVSLTSVSPNYTTNNAEAGPLPVLFASTNTDGTVNIQIDKADFYYDPSSTTLTVENIDGTASSALYADLAERYHSDEPYPPATVVVIGGDKEITITNIRANTSIAGVISENPGYMMNSKAGTDLTHPYVALKGRVKCKVVGDIKKGQRLVTSIKPGYAEAFRAGDCPTSCIGVALEDFNGDFGEIEIKV